MQSSCISGADLNKLPINLNSFKASFTFTQRIRSLVAQLTAYFLHRPPTMMNLLSFLLLLSGIYASPFELTEKYIEDFATGIKNLEKLSHETVFKEDSLDEAVLDEEDAAKRTQHFLIII